MAEKKITRLCWNDEGWIKPSGRSGKSRNPDTYEAQHGFGHEEWLFDMSKPIGEWHYGFLQGVNRSRDLYSGRALDILLYSIDDQTKQRWLVGWLYEANVLDADESIQILRLYEKKGWIKERNLQLRAVGANLAQLPREPRTGFFNIKFRNAGVNLFDPPTQLPPSQDLIRSNYYNLLNLPDTEAVNAHTNEPQFVITPGVPNKKTRANVSYDERREERDLIENKMQHAICRQLIKKYGKEAVAAENRTEYGCAIDIVLRVGNGSSADLTFYEIKNRYSARVAIRDALGQLLEYMHFPRSQRASKLIIACPAAPNADAIEYVRGLRERYKLPLYYQQYDDTTQQLKETLY